MSNKSIFFIGIFGVILFFSTCVIGGLLIENYSITSQYISETFAIDTEYGIMLRAFGHIPSGILFTIFSMLGYKYFPPSSLIKIGFYGLGLFYGVGTIVVAIFPCDSGCNTSFTDSSISQVIHNAAALLIYTFVPVSIIITSLGLKKFSNHRGLSRIALVLGVLIIPFVYLITFDQNPELKGLYQRVIESLILIWILTCAFKIKSMPNADLNRK